MSWVDLEGKDLLSTQFWERNELEAAVEAAKDLKRKYYLGESHELLKGDTFLMLFFNSSTRTRQTFETAMSQLGGHSQYLEPGSMRVSKEQKPGAGESIKDTAKVMSRFGEAVGIRMLEDKVSWYGEGAKIIEEFAEHAEVPVIDMASDKFHPSQGLSDLFTIKEALGDNLSNKKITISWAYSPWVRSNCSIQEEALIMSRFGMDVDIAFPKGYKPDEEVIEWTKENGEKYGGDINLTHDREEALTGAHIVFPRNWMTLDRYENGVEKEKELASNHKDWIYTADERDEHTDNAKFMHVMPVDRGNEAENEVVDTDSLMYDQAENLLHMRKAILALLVNGGLY